MTLFQALFRRNTRRAPLAGRGSTVRRSRRSTRTARQGSRLAAGEQLEGRLLLAFTIDSSTDLASHLHDGNYRFEDSDSITIANGTSLDFGGKNVVFDAPAITVGSNARIVSKNGSTAGSIEFTATKTQPNLPISIWNQVESVIQAVSTQHATIQIEAGAHIEGGAISFTATAGDATPSWWKDGKDKDGNPIERSVTTFPFLGQFSTLIAQYVNDLTSLPLSANVKQPSATIDLGESVQIVSSGDVKAKATATADASGQAIWSTLMEKVEQKARADDGNIPFGLAAGFSYTDAKAITTLHRNASVQAAGKVSLGTKTDNTASMSSRVTLNQGVAQTNPNNVELAFAVTVLNTTSKVHVEQNAAITSGKSVEIVAEAKDKNKVKANTASYRDGLVGLVGGTGISNATVEARVDGSVTAGSSSLAAPISFNPLFDVDFARSGIRIPAGAGYQTGDEVIYDRSLGGVIPGLYGGGNYFAIVDAGSPTLMRLAFTEADAKAGRAIEFGRYPTLTTAKGTIPVTAVDAAGGNTFLFDVSKWPNGSSLFTDGETVTFTPQAGQYLGTNAANGSLVGPLPAGQYRVRVVQSEVTDFEDYAIRLEQIGTGTPVVLNVNPLLTTASGGMLQIFSFSAETSEITLNFPKQGTGDGEVPFPTPDQSAAVKAIQNGDPLVYTQSLGISVPGLIDGRTYYAIVDATEPGVITLAETAEQAAAANPAIQNALPKLRVPAANPGEEARVLEIGNVEPNTGLVFSADPKIVDGTPVVYEEVPGRPIGGLVNGQTYYAYNQVNEYFAENFPQYLLVLRATADVAAPTVAMSLLQTLARADGQQMVIDGVDAVARMLALDLTQPAPITAVDAAALVGGTASVAPVAAGSLQIYTAAIGGTFTLVLPSTSGNPADNRTTAPLPFNASAATILSALQTTLSGVAGAAVTAVFGEGTFANPWLIEGMGLSTLYADPAKLIGGTVYGREVPEGVQRVSTSATGGSFQMTLDVDGTSRTTAAIAANATATQVDQALDNVPEVLATVWGLGTPESPWIIESRHQPIATGDPLTFHDAAFTQTPGLLAGQTYYAVVADLAYQGKPGSVVLSLARTASDAMAAEPALVPLETNLSFDEPDQTVMSGTVQRIEPWIRQFLAEGTTTPGITVSAKLESVDSQALKAANGSEPKLKDLLSRGDFLPLLGSAAGRGAITGLFTNLAFWNAPNKDYKTPISELIEKNLNPQNKKNEKGTFSVAGSYMSLSNTAHAIVGSTAVLRATGSVDVTAEIQESIRTSVESTVSRPGKANVGLAVAADILQIWNDSKAVIETNARVSGNAGVKVQSDIVYPWMGAITLDESKGWGPFFYQNTISNFSKLIGGKFGVDEWFINHWADAGVKQKGEKDPIDVTVAGSVSWLGFYNTNLAQIEDGAQINQDASSGDRGVSVTATTEMIQTGFAGNVYLDFSPDNWAKAKRAGKGFGNFDAVVLSGGKNALGGSVGYVEMQNDTRALLGGQYDRGKDAQGNQIAAPAPANPSRIAFGQGGLTVESDNDVIYIQLSQSGGNAAEFGFAGTASVLNLGSGAIDGQVSEAAIVAAAKSAEIKNISGTTGDLRIAATDSPVLVPIAGAVLFSQNKGVGMSTAIVELTRDVHARIGSAEDKAQPNATTLTTAGEVVIEATADGAIVPVALAAEDNSNIKVSGQPQQNAANGAGGENPGNVPTSVWGWAISGDYARGQVHDTVHAFVNDSGTFSSAAGTALKPSDKKFKVLATNDTVIAAAAGAATFTGSEDKNVKSFGLAGSAANIPAISDVRAYVKAVEIDKYDLVVTATNSLTAVSAAAGGTGAAVGNSAVAVAGSVAVNEIDYVTRASVDSLRGFSELHGLEVTAESDHAIWAVAGSFTYVGYGKAGADLDTGSNRIGISLGAGLNLVNQGRADGGTQAIITNAKNLDVTRGTVGIVARDTSLFVTAAAGAGIVRDGSANAGMFATSTVNAPVDATITGSGITVGNTFTSSSIPFTIEAAFTPLVVSFAGNVLVTTQEKDENQAYEGIGAAVTVATVSGAARTKVTSSTIDVGTTAPAIGSFTAKATSGPPPTASEKTAELGDLYLPHSGFGGVAAGGDANESPSSIYSFAIGATVTAAKVGANFAVTVNHIDIETKVEIVDSTVTLASGSVTLEAVNGSRIVAAAGAFAFGNPAADSKAKAAFGAAVARNRIAGDTVANVARSTVTSGPGATDVLTVSAKAGRQIYSFAVGAQGAQNSAGVSVTSNTIAGDVKATIDGSGSTGKVIQGGGSITLEAASDSLILSVAGQVDIATKGLAAGAAAAVNDIDVSTIALVNQATLETAHKSNSQPTQHAAVNVSATSNQSIKAFAVGVAGTLSRTDNVPVSFAGVGSGTGNTVVGDVSATVVGSTIGTTAAAVGATTLKADEQSEILAVAGALAFGVQGSKTVSAAVGVSAATNSIGRSDRRRKVEAVFGKGSNLLTTGDVIVQATGRPEIQAITAAGAGVFSSQSSTVGLAGAGAGSQNNIWMNIDAGLDTATVARVDGTTPSVKVHAANQSEIQAIAGGLAVAGRKADGTSVNVTVGAAAAVNAVDLTTTARMDGSTVNVPGSIEVIATGHEVITAYAFGVAGLLSGTSGVNFTGAGSATVNTIHSETTARVRGGTIGTTVQPSGVTIVAIDVPEVTAVAGAFDLAVFGGAKVALNVGVAFSINEISGKAAASIENGATVNSTGDVKISGLFGKLTQDDLPGSIPALPAPIAGDFVDRVPLGKTTVSTVVVAGSVAVGGGSNSGAVAFPLAGAGSRNTFNVATTASIDASTVGAGASVTLRALDASATNIVVGGVGLGITYGDIGLGIAIGYAYLENTFTNTVAAEFKNATVTATAAVAAQATSAQDIFARGFGVALSATIARGDSASVAGSGANVMVSLAKSGADPNVRARASGSTLTAGVITISALDNPSIDAKAGAGSLAVATGEAALSIAPGEVTVDVSLANSVAARAENGAKLHAGSSVRIDAMSTPKIDSLAVAAAAAASVAEYGAAFAGAGSRATIALGSTVIASASGGADLSSQLTSGDAITLQSTAKANVSATSGAGALAGALVGAAIGVSLAEVTNNDKVTSTADGATLTTSGGNVVVSVVGQNSMNAMSVPVAGAVALGGAGAGGHAFVTDNAEFSAKVTGKTSVITRYSGEPLPGAPDGTLSITSTATEKLRAEIDGGSAGLGSIGVFFADAKRSGKTEAILENAGALELGGLNVAATTDHTVDATGFSVTIGGLTGAGQTNSVTSDEQVTATWDDTVRPRSPDAARLITGSVAVTAAAKANARAELTGVNVEALGVGIYQAHTTVKPQVTSSLVAATLAAAGTLEVSATQSGVATARATAGSGGLIDGNAALTELTQAPTVKATVSGSASAAGIKVMATSQSDYDSYADSIQAAVVGASGARSTNTLTPNVTTTIDAGAMLSALSGMTVAADSAIQRTGSRDAVKIGAGGVDDGYIGSIDTIVTGTTTVDIRESASLTLLGDGRMDVRGTQTASIDEAVRIDNGGVITVGVVNASLTGTLNTNVTFGAAAPDKWTLQAPVGTIDIGTRNQVTADTNASANTYGLAGAAVSSANVSVTSNETVTLPRGVQIFGGDSVSLAAGSYDFGRSPSAVTAVSVADSEAYGLIEIPSADTSAKATASTKLNIAGLTKIISGGDLRLASTEPATTAHGQWHTAWNGTFSDAGTSDTRTVTTSAILGGTFVAGAYHHLALTISDANASDPTAWVTARGYGDAVRPFVAQIVPSFEPRKVLDSLSDTSQESKALVRDYLSSTPVSAVYLDQLAVSGGQVVIDGTLSGAGIVQAFAPSLTVENDSSQYLILGSLKANGGSDSGTIVVNGSQQTAGTIGSVRFTPFASGVAASSIDVVLTRPGPTGTTPTAAGPALFLEGEISNPAGAVTLRNDYGAFVDFGPITAESLTITVPNGPVVITTTGYFGVGGNTTLAWEGNARPFDPNSVRNNQYQYPTTFFFPGYTSNGTDGNFAVSTAAVALFNANVDGTWKNTNMVPAGPNAQNPDHPDYDQNSFAHLLYGQPTRRGDDQNLGNDNQHGDATIFFGSALPYIPHDWKSPDGLDGNKDGDGYADSRGYADSLTRVATQNVKDGWYLIGRGFGSITSFNRDPQMGNLPLLLPNLPTRAVADSNSSQSVFQLVGSGGITAAQLSIKSDFIDLNAPITAGRVAASRSLDISTDDQTKLLAYRDQFSQGQAQGRYYYPATSEQFSRSGNTLTQGSTIVLQADTSRIGIGQLVTGPGMPFGTQVTRVLADRFEVSRASTISTTYGEKTTLVFSPSSTTLPWRYDAELNQVEILDFTASTGKVSVLLDGKMLSTTDRGRISVQGGVGSFTISSATESIPVVLGEISSAATTGAEVRIQDRQANKQFLYVYSDSTAASRSVDVYTGALDVDLRTSGSRQSVDIGAVSFSPQQNLALNWSRGATLERSLTYSGPNNATNAHVNVQEQNPVPPWRFTNPQNAHGFTAQSAYTLAQAELSAATPFVQRVNAEIQDSQNYTSKFYDGNRNFTDYGYGFGNNTTWTWKHPTKIGMTLNASIKADYPVPIDFSRYQTAGTFSVTNAGGVILGDSVDFPGVVSIQSGSNRVGAPAAGITQSPGTVLKGGSIFLTSLSGSVGTRQTPVDLVVNGGALSAQVGKDGVYVSSPSALTFSRIGAATGDASSYVAWLQADRGIQGSDQTASIAMGSVKLDAPNGAIGAAGKPLNVQLVSRSLPDGSIAGGSLDASALGDISILAPSGDIRVGLVSSATGDVSMTARAGSILDARDLTPQGVAASGLSVEKAEEILARITASDAASAANTVTATQNSVNRDYNLYWMLQRYGTVDPAGSYVPASDSYDDLSVQLGMGTLEGDPSNDALSGVTATANGLYDRVVKTFRDAIGTNWQSQPEFKAFNASYAFTASAEQKEELVDGADANITPLTLASFKAVSPADPDTPAEAIAPNISGRNITLSAGKSIGIVAQSAVLPLTNMQLGQLTEAERESLALADSAGEIRFQGTDASGKTVMFDYGQTPAGVTPTAIVITVDEPLFVQASGTVSADAGDNQGGISLEQPAGNLSVGTIRTDGRVRLAAGGSVESPATQLVDVTGLQGIDLVAGQNLGRGAANPLRVLANGPVNASAGGDVTLQSGYAGNSAPLRLGTVEAGGTATIMSTGPVEAVAERDLDATISGFDIDTPAGTPAWVVNQSGSAADGGVMVSDDSLVFEKRQASTGKGEPSTQAEEPVLKNDDTSPPTDVIGVAGVESVALSWKAPADLGYPGTTLEGYAISYQESGNSNWSIKVFNTGSTATHYVVDGLKAGTSYRFRVTAVTNYGWGQDSLPTDFITPREGGEGVSVWYHAPLPLEHGLFATFVYEATGQGGMTFMVQNDPRGTAAVGAASALGAGGTAGQVRPSLAFQISPQGVAFGTNGSVGSFTRPGAVQLTGGQRIQVTVSATPFSEWENDPVSGGQIERHRTKVSATLVDVESGASFALSQDVDDLTALLRSPVGYVGFTAGFDNGQSRQVISEPLIAVGSPTITAKNVVLQSGSGVGSAATPVLVAAATAPSVSAPQQSVNRVEGWAPFQNGPQSAALATAPVPENNAPGAVVGTLSGVSPSSFGPVTYTLVDGDGGKDNGAFEIVGNELRARKSLNYEVQNAYSVRVRVANDSGVSIDRVFELNVANVANEPLRAEGITLPEPGTYRPGNVLRFVVTMSDIVTVRGRPRLAIGGLGGARWATYVGGSRTAQLTFEYQLKRNDRADTIVVARQIGLPFGTAITARRQRLSPRVPGEGRWLTLSGVSIDGPPRVEAVRTWPGPGTYRTGQALEFVVAFTEPVNVVGIPRLTIRGMNGLRHASYVSGSGGSELTFRYVVRPGDRMTVWSRLRLANRISLPAGASIADSAATAAELKVPPPILGGIRIRG